MFQATLGRSSSLDVGRIPAVPRKLNLGCGRDIRTSYLNVDAAALPGVDVVHDFSKFPWPLDGDRFEEIVICHVLEHLPDTVRTMEEIHRISSAGARIHIRVPYWNSFHSIGDPTHVKLFHQTSFNFFDPGRPQGQERNYYSRARFEIVRVHYWVPLLPFLKGGAGRGWVRISSPLLKLPLTVLSHFLCNIIWVLEFELRALKEASRP